MCLYCDFNKDSTYPTRTLYDDKVVEVMLNKYKELEVNPYGYDEHIDGILFEIKYCPVCGRKL